MEMKEILRVVSVLVQCALGETLWAKNWHLSLTG